MIIRKEQKSTSPLSGQKKLGPTITRSDRANRLNNYYIAIEQVEKGDPLLSQRNTEAILGCHTCTLWRYRKMGLLHVSKVFGLNYYQKEEILNLLRSAIKR